MNPKEKEREKEREREREHATRKLIIACAYACRQYCHVPSTRENKRILGWCNRAAAYTRQRAPESEAPRARSWCVRRGQYRERDYRERDGMQVSRCTVLPAVVRLCVCAPDLHIGLFDRFARECCARVIRSFAARLSAGF